MNERTKEIISKMTPWEWRQYRNYQGIIDFLDTIRPTELSTDKERRAEFPDRDCDRC